MMATSRMTWKRIAQVFAVSLSYTTCTDHGEPQTSCPYCRDSDAVQLYEAKRVGQVEATWQEVATRLAGRFQHFQECTDHRADAADLDNCPFCRDGEQWRRYVEFCGRQGVQPVRRDVDACADGAIAVSIYDLRGVAKPGITARQGDSTDERW